MNMARYVSCDACGVMHLLDTEEVPAGWTFTGDGEHYCDGKTFETSCAGVGRALRKREERQRARLASH
jgi:hypothetical protein